MKNITKILIFATSLLLASTSSLYAREFKGDVKAPAPKAEAACLAATNSNDLTLNNVSAFIKTNGTMWNRISLARYEVPKGSGKTSMFAAALWIGGRDVSGQLKLAAVRFNQVGEDFWTGPLSRRDATIPQSECLKWDKHFKITRAEVKKFCADFEEDPGNVVIPNIIKNWPAHGDTTAPLYQSFYLAPFMDVNEDGIYDAADGDYPYYDFENELCPWTKANIERAKNDQLPKTPEDADGRMGMIYADHVLKGDETLYWIFNDAGNTHTESGGATIGLEIRGQAFSFATNDDLNNMTFYSYEIINRSTYELTDAYFSKWVDPDLGYADDDYVGCDVIRGLGYCYNGTDVDGTGQEWAYGNQPPAVGVDFFQGPYIDADGRDNPKFYKDSVGLIGYCESFINSPYPIDQMAINGVNFGDSIVDNERFGMRRFVYHDNDNVSPTRDPHTADEYYKMLRGIWRDNVRMTYGGNAYALNPTTPECDFMFPGMTDPCHWGTAGVDPNREQYHPTEGWTDKTAGNDPLDRRFMQSAGPFRLKAGSVNYITVGIPWARASAGGAWASVELLKIADDRCQSLFENCFKVLDGPDAPDMTIIELENELILCLTDFVGGNNENESYAEVDAVIPESINGVLMDQEYLFEGYQIYQLASKDVSVTDLNDLNKARLVRQCDIENYRDNGTPIGQLINWVYDEQIALPVPTQMVNGANIGISHTFSITDDAFALGETRLVNHKTYYYMVIAYAYNEYMPFAMDDIGGLLGQKTPYLAGRNNIKVYSAIPHKPLAQNNGTVMNASYGTSPEISRIEGQGNGGIYLDLTDECREKIVTENKVSVLNYKKDAGPISVKVIDPLRVQPFDYTLKMKDGGNEDVTDTTYWVLTVDNQDVDIATLQSLGFDYYEGELALRSTASIAVQNEQLLLPLGISLTIRNSQFKIHQQEILDYVIEQIPTPSERGLNWLNYSRFGQVDLLKSVSLAEITYSDNLKPWLGGVLDTDGDVPSNWIRAGQKNTGIYEDPVAEGEDERSRYEYWSKADMHTEYQSRVGTRPRFQRAWKDPKAQFDNVISSTWAPYPVASPFMGGPQAKYITPDNTFDENLEPSPAYYTFISCTQAIYQPGYNPTMTNLYSVDIVLTADKSKWTRSIVLESCDDATLSIGGALKNEPRKSKSVDKDGRTATDDVVSSDPNHPNYMSAYGMGWFPGYAVNIETGERLNIMFAENSSDPKNNGTDMLFNPTSVYAYYYEPIYEDDVVIGYDTIEINAETYDALFESRMMSEGAIDWSPTWGGKHFVYVCGSSGNSSSFFMRPNIPDPLRKRNFNDANKTRLSNSASHGGYIDSKYPYYECGAYDKGEWLLKKFETFVGQSHTSLLTHQKKMQLYNNVMWTSISMPRQGYEEDWLSTDALLRIRVTRPYLRYHSRWYDSPSQAPSEEVSQNNGFPMYKFSMKSVAPTTQTKEEHDNILSEINIVPNPYYGFSTYEGSRLENMVKVVNLPDDCTISIYTVNGTLVRKLRKNSPTITYVDWDLKNSAGIPVAGGIYIIHVKAEGVGERTLKFFCAMRPADLNAF